MPPEQSADGGGGDGGAMVETPDAGSAGGDATGDAAADAATDAATDAAVAVDCMGTPGGNAVEDCSGVCNGDAVPDCAGVCNGDAVPDCAGTCNGDAVPDCAGTCNGDAVPDCAGDCNGDAGPDCAGTCNGDAVPDCAGVCNGDAVPDCAGTCNGAATLDCAGTCNGAATLDCAGTCNGTATPDCAGTCNGSAAVDMCGTCDADSGNDCTQDCAGTWGGAAVEDCRGVCGGSAVVDCAGICDGDTVVDCAGTCNGSAVADCAGVCNGAAELDCAGVCNGSAAEDCLGVCGGSASCPETPCDAPGSRDPLSALAGETCYGFQVHAPGSSAAFSVATGESYHEFVYAIPWAAGTVATRYGIDLAGSTVPYKVLVFGQSTADPDGTVRQNVTGTTLGTSATAIGIWVAGGCNFEFPGDVGLELPESDQKLMTQWHMYNNTGVAQLVSATVTYCTLPGGSRTHTAGMTFLGTENFNGPAGMPPGANEFSSTCTNDSGAPIHLFAFWPHMHQIGTNMRSDVQASGASTWTTVSDRSFTFFSQVHYAAEPTVVLQPDDTIRSTCSYFNDTGANVAFGESTNQEQCYQFAFSYPAGALDNGALSLIGALNTCW
jgi:hypothetical protein